MNSILGDFERNAAKIINDIHRANERHCDLIVFPEAALFGYHPVDLLERPNLVLQQERVLQKLAKKIPPGIGVMIGAIVRNPNLRGKAYLNAAVFLEKGKKPKIFAKQLLPSYDVFDESRHIEPGDTTKNIFKFKGHRILVTICEDIWAWPQKGGPKYSVYGANPLTKIRSSAVDLVINLSASPFTGSKFKNRRRVVGATVNHFRKPMVYVNMVGAQDELIFDGGSFALDAKGQLIAQCIRFDEDFNVLDLQTKEASLLQTPSDPRECIRAALVLGIRDFVKKTGFTRVNLGLSGGIDSALVACLAADALGPMNVTGIAMPGPFSSDKSLKLAEKLATSLGIEFHKIPITNSYHDVLKSYEDGIEKTPFSIMNENIQARLRGLLLMAFSNEKGSLVLGTSNKSELAVGYSTLYGDLCGALLPIGDLLKTEVYELANYYNSEAEVIPQGIIDRPPSAELRPNQKDEDSLPPYAELDPIVKKIVEGFYTPKTEIEKRILKMMMQSEFKRWQAPPILKISDHAFGRGRRLPVAHHAIG